MAVFRVERNKGYAHTENGLLKMYEPARLKVWLS